MLITPVIIGTASAGPPPPVLFLSDNLTSGSFGADISGSSAQVGGTWTKLSGPILFFGASGSVCGGTAAQYTNTVVPSTADYVATLILEPTTSPTDIIGVNVRVSNTNQDYYGVRWNGSNNRFELFKSVNNSITVLQFISGNMNSGSGGVTTSITITVTGSSIAWTVGGVSQTGSTDSSVAVKGLVGLSGIQGGGSSLMHFHDVTATG